MLLLAHLEGPHWADKMTGIATVLLAIFTFLTLVVASWAASFAREQVEDSKRSRHGSLVIDLTSRWNERTILRSEELYTRTPRQDVLDLFTRIFRPTPADLATRARDVRQYTTLTALPNLIETIGVLRSEQVLTPELIYKMWGPLIALSWRNWAPAVQYLRELQGRPGAYKHFDALGEEMALLDAAEIGSVLRRP
jgi:hypothetical protein